MILHEIFRVVSRFPRYISCYIAEYWIPLGHCSVADQHLFIFKDLEVPGSRSGFFFTAHRGLLYRVLPLYLPSAAPQTAHCGEALGWDSNPEDSDIWVMGEPFVKFFLRKAKFWKHYLNKKIFLQK